MVEICPWCLFLSLLAVSLLASPEDFSGLYPGNITGDTYLFFGEGLKLNCNMNDALTQVFTAHDVTFKVQHEPNNHQKPVECIPQSHITVVDSVAVLVIQNVTVENQGPYACYVGSQNCTDNDTSGQTVGISDDVFVEYAPQNVTNFQCVVYNWGDYMICTWQHPVAYRDWSKIEVNITFMISGHQDSAYKCPNASDTSCTWNKESVMLGNNYGIEVTVTNSEKKANASSVFIAGTSKIVKPAPVRNLSIVASKEEPGCLVLSWTHPDKHNAKKYRIKHEGETACDGNRNFTDRKFITCGYLPYTRHSFSVECYPTQLFSGYWSEPVYASFLTPMTAPAFGPQAKNGSFVTTDCVQGSRSVTLMWQKVEAAAQNGLIDFYLIKSGNGIEVNVSADVYLANVILPCYKPSKVTISAHNEGGYSLEPTVLSVPPVTFTVPMDLQETFSVNGSRRNGSTYRSVWQVSDRTTTMNYTIFWCTGTLGKPCKGQLKWSRTIQGTDTFYDIHLPDLDVDDYIIGISVTDPDTGMSSGIFWTKCIFFQNPFASHHKTVEDLKVEGDVEKANIFWSKIQCTYQSLTKVTGYKIKWCELHECNDTDSISSAYVPATESMYTVSALKADVKYAFTVQPVSYEVMGEEVKPWVQVIPAASENYLIWIIPILVAVCLTVVAVVIYRSCQKSRAKIKNLVLDRFLVLADGDPRVVTLETILTSDPDNRTQATARLLTAQSNNSIDLAEPCCENRQNSPRGNNSQEVPSNMQHQHNSTDQELLPSHLVSADLYHHITHYPSEQLSEFKNEPQNQDPEICQNPGPSASRTDKMTHFLSSHSSEVIHDNQVSMDSNSVFIDSYHQAVNYLPNSSQKPIGNISHDEETDQGLVHSDSGSISAYHQIVNYLPNSSPPTDVLCQDDRTDQVHSISGSLQPYHQVAYCEPDQLGKDKHNVNHQLKPVSSNPGSSSTDLSIMIGHDVTYLPDSVMPSHHHHISHVQYDNKIPLNKMTDQKHSTCTQGNVQSPTLQPASASVKLDLVTTMTPNISVLQGHTTVDIAPSLTAETGVSDNGATSSEMSRSRADVTFFNMQAGGDYVPCTSIAGHHISEISSTHSSFSDSQFSDNSSAVPTDYIQVAALSSSSTHSDDSF